MALKRDISSETVLKDERVWLNVKRVVDTSAYAGANDEFHVLRHGILGSTPEELVELRDRSSLTWEFLVGVAENKNLLRNLIVQIVFRLRADEGWRTAFDSFEDLRMRARCLQEELSRAFSFNMEEEAQCPPGPETTAKIQQLLDEKISKDKPIRIAIIGKRGVGKSTILNSLRRKRPTDASAAKVGADEVVEAEQEESAAGRNEYSFGGIIFEDVPGCEGSVVNVSMGQEYMDRYKLTTADAAIIVYTTVLEPKMLSFAALMGTKNVPCFLVRNKVGSDCENEVENGNADNLDQAFQQMKTRAIEQIDKASDTDPSPAFKAFCEEFKKDDKIFLVEARYRHAVATLPPREKFQQEFHRLRKAVEGSIYDVAKQAQLVAVLQNNAKELARTYSDQCRELIPYYQGLAAASGAVPVPGASEVGILAIATTAATHVLTTFRLHEKNFSHSEDLSAIKIYLASSMLASIGTTLALAVTVNYAADALILVPVAGLGLSILVGGVTSGYMMGRFMEQLVDKLTAIAEKVYEVELLDACDEKALLERRQNAMALIDELFPN